MKKIRRNLTSGLYLFVFLMIIEVLLIILVQFFLDNIFQALGIQNSWMFVVWGSLKLFESIFVVVLYHKILNRAEDPEFKIAWLIFLLIFPLFTAFIYVVFGNHGISHSLSQSPSTSKQNSLYHVPPHIEPTSITTKHSHVNKKAYMQ